MTSFGPVYINGRAYSYDAAAVSVLDRGLLFGDGLFETMLSRRGRVFRLAQHLARMREGMQILRMGLDPDDLDLSSAVSSTVDESAFNESRVRLTVTRGMYNGSYVAHKAERPTVMVTVQDISNTETPGHTDLILSSFRKDERSPLSRAKTLNYLPSVLARAEAEDAGASDAVLLNTGGRIAEAASSNLFLVKKRRLITPDTDSGILPGIIRAVALEIAESLHIAIEERPVGAEELLDAEEIFLTNSIAGIQPVRRFAGKPVGTGDHVVTRRLSEAYLSLVSAEIG